MMTDNKAELGALHLQEMYEVNGNPNDVSEVLKIFQASRRNRNLRSSLRDNMVSFDFIPRSAIYDVFHIYLSLIITYHGKL